jgi:predicted enzyme related to lactoylglutathione lyase
MFDSSTAFSSFAVDDTTKAKAFYGGTLGFEVKDLGMGGLIGIEVGGGTPVMVYPKPDFVPATYTVLSFPVADLEAAVDDLVSKGVTMQRYDGMFPGVEQDERGIARGPEGPAIAWFTDPAGNILAVMDQDGAAS